ncbi:MAG: amino acid adenylation domain-containing protein [Nitrospira sp.]|nr:amino acid adenylation domain-containing protein [Nitrospira sp.]
MVTLHGKSEIYYRTGDVVRKSPSSKYYSFYGRIDSQLKIFGMRIELGEIEAALREITGSIEVAAVGWPLTDGGVGGIVAFIGGGHADTEDIKRALGGRLPRQMIPREIRVVEKMPLNVNGKIDRLALRNILEEGK